MPVDKQLIFTVQSPNLLEEYNIANSIVVVIDILRATSSIVAGLSNGIEYIIPADNIDLCKKISKEHNAFTAGERNGKKIEGFDFGNSPLQLSDKKLINKRLALTTTNGTYMLKKSEKLGAAEIIMGSFLNLSQTAKYLRKQNKDVILACAGWKRRINLEDVLFAGALAKELSMFFDYSQCDSTFLAMLLFDKADENLSSFYPRLSHYKRLKNYGAEKDIEYCFQKNIFNTLVKYDGEKLKLFD